MLVKACGLRNLEEIHWAHDLGYDLFGIVVDPKSKRYVSTQELEPLWQNIPWRNRCVLVARKWQNLALYARFCCEAFLQCYESYPQFIPPKRRLMPVAGEEQWQLCKIRKNSAYYLYDISLGSGEWHGLPSWCRDKEQLFVAGGLNQDRLQELAIKERGCRYFGFDLSSGLEDQDDKYGRSRKDHRKMQECLQIIRNNFLGS